MQDLIEAIRAAVAEGATADQKARGADACRAILAALGAEAGKPIAMPGASPPNPLAGIDPGQAIDLLIAKLSSMLAREDQKQPNPAAAPPGPPMTIRFIPPPTTRIVRAQTKANKGRE